MTHANGGDTGQAEAKAADLLQDGRRARAERSRQQIVDALFALVRAGEISPGAARVAETANVSLRTVFRHFEEMDILYREMARQCEEMVMPVLMQPYESADWQGRLRELLARRMGVYEEIMYLRICTETRRFRSDVLMEDFRQMFRRERESIAAMIPDQHRRDESLLAALDVAMSFETYRRLRLETGLPVARARAVIADMLDMILTGAGS